MEFEKLKEIIAEILNVDPDEITMDTTFVDDLGADSLDIFQIIMGIATDQLKVGETLPSVRQLADTIGINMHTVNKAYSVLRQEGYVKLDRRRGAVVSLDVDKIEAMETLRSNLNVVLACGICKNITREEVHQLVDEIYDRYTRACMEDTEENQG